MRKPAEKALLSGSLEETVVTSLQKSSQQKASETVEIPKTWSAEVPNLYELILEVYDEAGALQEIIRVF